jgi:hypothetical protein
MEQITKREKFFRYFTWGGIVMAYILFITLSFWWLYPYKIVDYKNLPFPIMNENKEVKRGERLRYKIEACKYTNQVPDLVKFFIDGVSYETLRTVGVVKKGCNTIISDAYVPKAIPAGAYRLSTVVRYKVNPIRTIEFINITEEFIVK